MEATASGLAPDLAVVRGLVYHAFAAEGRAPSIAELARLAGLPEGAVRVALGELHARHLLVLAPDRDAVRMAHPFSAAPMGFVVRAGDRRWWGGCTWDSFGIGAALGEPIRIETTCPTCLRDLEFDGGPDRPPEPDLVARIPVAAARWWADVVWTCANIRTFCSAGHAAEHAARCEHDLGTLVPIEQLWRLARPWYGDRLAPDYAPRTRDASQAILDSVGLTGDFWRLP